MAALGRHGSMESRSGWSRPSRALHDGTKRGEALQVSLSRPIPRRFTAYNGGFFPFPELAKNRFRFGGLALACVKLGERRAGERVSRRRLADLLRFFGRAEEHGARLGRPRPLAAERR